MFSFLKSSHDWQCNRKGSSTITVKNQIMGERQCLGNNETRRFSAILCLVSALAFLLSFSSMIAVLTYEKVKADGDSDEAKLMPFLCVNCDDLILKGTIPGSDQLLAKFNRSQNSNQCCVENSEQISAFLQLALMQSIPKDEVLHVFDPTNFTLSKASVHMRLLPMDWYRSHEVKFFGYDLETGFREATLKKTKPYAQHERNMKIDTDGVTIVMTGTYLVYSSIHFIPVIETQCKYFPEQVWYQRVKRIRQDVPDAPETLLSGVFTCSDDTSLVHETVYTAGVFHLQANDTIRVYISGMGLVSYLVESTFMGVVMLGDGDPMN